MGNKLGSPLHSNCEGPAAAVEPVFDPLGTHYSLATEFSVPSSGGVVIITMQRVF